MWTLSKKTTQSVSSNRQANGPSSSLGASRSKERREISLTPGASVGTVNVAAKRSIPGAST